MRSKKRILRTHLTFLNVLINFIKAKSFLKKNKTF
jgi:hypothetical protein